jgi:hypothetical protein
MNHRVSESLDLPPEVLLDRRCRPERRSVWRGGRRDSDWINRPPGALGRARADEQRLSVIRRWLAGLVPGRLTS